MPSDFRPANYTRADLFDAVAVSRAMSYNSSIRRFVSDVVFVRQDGTNITFRTDDNAISATMKVASRTGLTPGQRVRIYYTLDWPYDWWVRAIERL